MRIQNSNFPDNGIPLMRDKFQIYYAYFLGIFKKDFKTFGFPHLIFNSDNLVLTEKVSFSRHLIKFLSGIPIKSGNANSRESNADGRGSANSPSLEPSRTKSKDKLSQRLNLREFALNLRESAFKKGLSALTNLKKGQAMVELAIFGSLIILLLGTLIAYGLRYMFQQQAQMQAFRKALEIAYELDGGKPRGSASYVLIKDRHIPDPSSPFGIGQVNPFMASASVSRDSYMDQTADNYAGLPKTYIHFQSKVNGQLQDQYFNLTVAGLRNEDITVPGNEDDYGEVQEKYAIVYGGGSVGGWCESLPGNQSPDYSFDDDCAGEDLTLIIVDSVEGEIVDYEGAIRQARLIVDYDYCYQECERGKAPGDDLNCANVCSTPIESPWYVSGAYYDSGLNRWIFPEIENLFVLPSGKEVQNMGPLPDYTQQTTTDFTMTKEEDDVDITTTDTTYWSTVTNRQLYYNDHLDKVSGYVYTDVNKRLEDYSSTTSDTRSFTWETPWSQ